MKVARVIAELETELARMYGRRHCRFVSRGSVAIFLALKAVNREGSSVILPSILCMSPANATMYAGYRPLFCDVSLTDFNLDIDFLQLLLEQERDIAAVILPHIYGQPTDIERVAHLAREFGVLLIEDVAQAMGGKYKGRPLGSFGDFSILSFGHTKIIDAGGGGAVLFDDDGYVDIIEQQIRNLPSKVDSFSDLQAMYSKTYYALQNLVGTDRSLARLYRSFPDIFRDLYLFRDVDDKVAARAYDMLAELDRIVAERSVAAEFYRTNLKHETIVHPKYEWDGVYWRYSFLVNQGKQELISSYIREQGVHVSNWYPPLHLFYESELRELSNAEYLGSHIFNLWVEPGYSRDEQAKAVNVVLEALDATK